MDTVEKKHASFEILQFKNKACTWLIQLLRRFKTDQSFKIHIFPSGLAAENLCSREDANLEFSQTLPEYMQGR